MEHQTILVIGGTGLIGRPVVEQLHKAGARIRLFVRNLERARTLLNNIAVYEYIEGDVDNPTAIEHALDGCTGVHISLRTAGTPEEAERVEHRGTARIAALAARHAVSRLTYVSGMLVSAQSGLVPDQVKYRAEQAIQQSGVPFTIFRPTYFMDTLPQHVQGKLAIILGRQPYPFHMVAARDFARMVVQAYGTPDAANRHFYVHGSQAITLADALRLYCRLVEPEKHVISIPIWFMRMIDRVFMHQRLQSTLMLMAYMEHVGECGDPSQANEILGAPTTTVHQWCEQEHTRRLTCK